MAKKYLVTGGAGFIGSHLTRRLLELGHKVWILDNLRTGFRENVPSGATFLQIDLSDVDMVDTIPEIPFDAVFHLAAQSSGEISFDDPGYDVRTNVVGTLQLLRWCQRRGVLRFLYASSMSIYGDVGEQAIDEDHPCRPKSFYGVGKLTSELYLDIFNKEGMRTTAFRMFNAYGPGQNLTNMRQGMVSIFLAYLLSGQELLVRGSMDRYRDFIYIDDLVSGWLAALDNPASWGKTYNLAAGSPTRVKELIRGLLRAFDKDPEKYPITQGEGTPGDQFGIYADISRIQSDLGWSPQIDLPTGLERMVAWARQSTAQS